MTLTSLLPSRSSRGDGAPPVDVPVRRSRWLLWIVLLGLVLLAELASLLALRSLEDPVRPAAAPDQRVLLVTGGGLSDDDPLRVAKQALTTLRTQGLAVAHPRAGFTAGAVPLSKSVLGDVPGTRLDMVVVQGGEQDVARPPAQVEQSARGLVEALRRDLGARLQVVLVGPVPPADGTVDPRLARVGEALSAAAEDSSAVYVDAAGLGWRTDGAGLGEALAAALVPLLPEAGGAEDAATSD